MTEVTFMDALTHAVFDDYQAWTLTKKRGGLLTNCEVVSALGLAGEAGECVEIVKKGFQKERVLTDDEAAHLAEELGDVLYYLSVLADHIGYDLSDIARININKLEGRYPDVN